MKTVGCMALLIGALALLGGGCAAADVTAVSEPVAGTSATRASYAYSTPYGELWEVDGEIMPAGYGRWWDAVVIGPKSSIDHGYDCGMTCDVKFKASMAGLWHTTSQTIHWTIDGQAGSSEKVNFGWSCMVRFAPLNCGLAEREDVHEVSVQTCSWTAKVHADHAAWWGAWFDLEVFGKKIGQIGRVSASSVGEQRTVDLCPRTPGSGTGTPSICYDYYLVWTDEAGYHEIYLGSWCFGAAT